MAFLASNVAGDVGLKLLLSPLGSNVVVRTACCSVGIALPVYSTVRAIESRDETEQRKWLLYWAAYGSFSLVEVFTDKLISWVPFYYHLKFAFLVWLQLPTVDGAKHLYSNHLRPFFLRHQARINRVVDFTYAEMAKQLSAHQAEIHYAKVMVQRIMGSGSGSGSGPSASGEDTRRAAAAAASLRRLGGANIEQNTITEQSTPANSTSDEEESDDHEN